MSSGIHVFRTMNTAFREGEISIDGAPAGAAPVYQWIYTGGIDPFFWEPISGGSGFEFLSLPHRFDAVRGCVEQRAAAHDCAVYNADDYFSATGTLLVYLDHGAQQVTGQVTENTIESGPTPTINENVQTDSSGNITGTVKTTSSRQFKAAGFVNTSHGRVDTQVKQTVNFKK
jgi:hypothetical protein